jgi:hypothetical protein
LGRGKRIWKWHLIQGGGNCNMTCGSWPCGRGEWCGCCQHSIRNKIVQLLNKFQNNCTIAVQSLNELIVLYCSLHGLSF